MKHGAKKHYFVASFVRDFFNSHLYNLRTSSYKRVFWPLVSLPVTRTTIIKKGRRTFTKRISSNVSSKGRLFSFNYYYKRVFYCMYRQHFLRKEKNGSASTTERKESTTSRTMRKYLGNNSDGLVAEDTILLYN